MTSKSLHKPSFEEYLTQSVVSRAEVDKYLQGSGWNAFDPELGYVHRTYEVPPHTFLSGIGGYGVLSTQQSHGARRSFMHADQQARINTYGNSFTQCTQVNDGESWQEYLAGHLCEPIGNFGVAAYGCYQAYLRLLRVESTNHGAPYLIYYIWGDDPFRNLYRCLAPLLHHYGTDGLCASGGLSAFFSMPRPNVEMNLANGELVEKRQMLSAPQSLYSLCEPEWMLENLSDDFALQLVLFKEGATSDLDRSQIDSLAKRLDFQFDWTLPCDLSPRVRGSALLGMRPNDRTPRTLQSEASALLDRYACRVTNYILDSLAAFAKRNAKELLVVLFDPHRALAERHAGLPRYDQDIVSHLCNQGFLHFDMNEAHLEDFRRYSLSWDDYLKQFFVDGRGHYNARGNHFFAYAIKDQIVQWLEPKPFFYRTAV